MQTKPAPLMALVLVELLFRMVPSGDTVRLTQLYTMSAGILRWNAFHTGLRVAVLTITATEKNLTRS